MKRKRQKGYWVKKSESFQQGAAARTRAASLRNHEHVAYVTVDRREQDYVVNYSVAEWYLAELHKAGVRL